MTDVPHWSDPGAFEVAPGIHRIPLPLPMDGLKAVNVYVIETSEGLTLVDGGWALEVARDLLEKSLNSIGHHPRDITSFLVTHMHRDHYTQAIAIRREFGRAVVSLGVGERPALEVINSATTDPRIEPLVKAGAHDLAVQMRALNELEEFSRENWEFPDVWLDQDPVIDVGERTLHAIHTPGHTRGHFVFADLDNDLLFAGDHVLPTITPSIGLEPAHAALPLADFLSSLLRVRELPDLRLLPAHGAPDRRSHERVDELLAHHDHRLAICAAAVSPEGSSAQDVARRITWTRHERSYAELDPFNQALACTETMTHLDLLVHQGRLSSRLDGGTLVYSPASA
ncbi:MAG: MBL fold metallo-hydrolase [Nocardioidaceae bacterium]